MPFREAALYCSYCGNKMNRNSEFQSNKELEEEWIMRIQILLRKRKLISAIEHNDGVPIYQKDTIYKIYGYDNEHIELDMKIDNEKCFVNYNKQTKILKYLPDRIIEKYEKKEQDFQIIRQEDFGDMHLFDSKKDEILIKFQKQLMGLVKWVQLNKQYNKLISGSLDYEKETYTFENLKMHTYQVAGILIKNHVFFKEPLYEKKSIQEIPDTQVQGLLLIMDMRELGFEKAVVVGYTFKYESQCIWAADYKSGKNRSEWYTGLKKDLAKNRLTAPNMIIPVPRMEVYQNGAEKFSLALNKHKIKEYFGTEIKETVYFGAYSKIQAEIEEDGRYLYEKPQDIFHMPEISTFYEVNGKKIPVKYLSEANAYTITGDGIYYVRKGKVYLRNTSDQVKEITESKDTIRILASKKYLFLTEVEKYDLIRCNIEAEYHFGGGYSYNEYMVLPKTRIINLLTGKEISVCNNFGNLIIISESPSRKGEDMLIQIEKNGNIVKYSLTLDDIHLKQMADSNYRNQIKSKYLPEKLQKNKSLYEEVLKNGFSNIAECGENFLSLYRNGKIEHLYF